MEPRVHVGDIIVTRHGPGREPRQGPGHHGHRPRPPREDAHPPGAAPGGRRQLVLKGDANHERRLDSRLRRRRAGPRRGPRPLRGSSGVLDGGAQLAAPGRHRTLPRLVPRHRGCRTLAPLGRDRRLDGDDGPAVPPLAHHRHDAGTDVRGASPRPCTLAAITGGSPRVAGSRPIGGPPELPHPAHEQPGLARSRAAAPFVVSYSQTVLADSPQFYWRLGETSGTAAADAASTRHRPGERRLHLGSDRRAAEAEQPTRRSASTAATSTSRRRCPATPLLRGDLDQDHADHRWRAGLARSRPPARSAPSTWAATARCASVATAPRSSPAPPRSTTAPGTTSSTPTRARAPTALSCTSTGLSTRRPPPASPRPPRATGAPVRPSGAAPGPASPDQFFRGDLDEVAVYTTVLTAQKVTNRYAAR